MNSPALEIRPVTAAETYPLRHAVLWPDKPYDYVRVENDGAGHHFGAFLNEQLVAVISLFIDGEAARFRKFATHPSHQRQGIGTRLLQYVLAVARQHGARHLWCDARQDATALYRRFGMQAEGAVFYKGPIAYQRMHRDL